jgi:hypothetical protein
MSATELHGSLAVTVNDIASEAAFTRVRCPFLNPIGGAAKINFLGFNVREYSCFIAAARLALVNIKWKVVVVWDSQS